MEAQPLPAIEETMENLPVPCQVFTLDAGDALIFSKANSAADRLLRITHDNLKGMRLEQAFPQLADSVVPERYKHILATGSNWGYHGVYYDESGNFIGLFHIHAFRLTDKKLACFLTPDADTDTEVIIHKSPLTLSNHSIDYGSAAERENRSPKPATQATGATEFTRDRVADTDMDNILFTDLFTIVELEAIQKAFCDVTGVASIITMPDGTPITRQENFCTFCRQVIRSTQQGLANCIYSDSIIGKPNHQGPTIRPCLSGGLWDGGASIIVGGKHVANWLIGQVRLSNSVDENRLREYAREIGTDESTFMAAYHEVPIMNSKQFYRTCNSLYLFANLLSEMAYQNLRLARANAAQKEITLALRHSKSRLHRLSSKLILSQEDERKRLALELHDGIGQSLTAVNYSVHAILANLQKPEVDLRNCIDTSSRIIASAIAEVRKMQVELRPRILDELGAIAAIQWLCREYLDVYKQFTIDLNINIQEELIPAPLKAVLFRIAQEAMNNAAKYSEGDTLFFSLLKIDDEIHLTIRDNGKGFDLEKIIESDDFNRGLGLEGMKERAELCDGTLTINSAAGKGTRVTACWPISNISRQ
ncbi:PocR ligand-binding domain-containing protein [Desulfosediminicola sp.]|uniref:PocR ligand-binding domain-containing protein n=1 Tax=Desulfosediminicola sp. TaxID=2886825 RepID=UPI003AF27E24